MKLSNNPILGLILSSLFHRLNGSFFPSFSCCRFSNNNNNEDELDVRVYDPNRGQERQGRMRERMNANPVAAEQTTRKSILRTSQSISSLIEQPEERTIKKSVSFASDNVKFFFLSEDKPETTGTTESVLVPSIEPSSLTPILADFTFKKYDVEGGEEACDILSNYIFPQSIVELMVINYPGLEHVRLSHEDFAGLVLLAKYHRSPFKFFTAANLLKFFHIFLTAFPYNLELIQTIQIDVGSTKLTKSKALTGLLRAAFKHSLYYTIEAFYSAHDRGIIDIDVFIKLSINFKNQKLFERYLSEKPDINPQELVKWSIQFGNIDIFNKYFGEIVSIDRLKPLFLIPIIIYIAKHGFYFPGIVDKLFEKESEHFDEALAISINSGNHKLFSDLIKFDNSYFSKSQDPKILTILRTIYTGGPTIVTEFESDESLKELFKIILKLDSNDPGVLRSFKDSVPDLITSEFITDILLLSFFIKTRDYMKMILESSDQLYLTIKSEKDGVTKCLGIWSFLIDTPMYYNIMKTISNSPSFHILHAVANPDFPKSLWPNVIMRFFNDFKQVSGISYEELCERYGFNSDIFSRIELSELHLLSRRSWSLLELSVLHVNLEAVIQLKDYHDKACISKVLNMANLMRVFIGYSPDYLETHPMTTLEIKDSFVKQFKLSKPEYFNGEIEKKTPEIFHFKLISDLNQIISILEQSNNKR